MKKNKNTSYGDNSTNIGNAKRVVINYDTQQNVEINDYEKRKIKEIKVNPKKITLLGTLGTGTIFLAYIGIFIKFPILEMPELMTYFPLILIFFLFVFIIGRTLKRRKFIPLPRNYSIESDDKSISLKKTRINCPKCESKMRIFQNENGVFISCYRNPQQHVFMFDYTTFIDTE